MTLNFSPRGRSQVTRLKERYQIHVAFFYTLPDHFKGTLVACLAICRGNKYGSLNTFFVLAEASATGTERRMAGGLLDLFLCIPHTHPSFKAGLAKALTLFKAFSKYVL